ncbi:MAG: sulfatase-like hydrolase/transferase [Vicinamibacterales bacterium]
MSRSVRHNFILILVALSGCLAAFGGWRFAKASAPVNGPVVLISIDALRADRLPAYGYAAGRTPHIDALAADGTVFERAYAHVPQTLPAHASLLTGRLPFETGVRDAAGFTVPASARTIAELLRDRGYATGGIVSSFLLRRDTGINRGFAFFDDELPAPTAGSPDAGLVRDGAAAEEVAEHWLESIGTSRAFLFLHISEPHAPHVPQERFRDLASAYDGEVAHADGIVGRLLQFLKSHQLYDRSTIILVADHGEGLGDHGEQTHGVLAYEPMLRVPLIVKQPAGAAAGTRVTTPVQHIDVVPTILDFAKAPGASGLRGRSLVPLLSGSGFPERAIYAESMFAQFRFGWSPVTSVILKDHQFVRSGTREELFDLTVPAEARVDIAAQNPALLAELRERLAEIAVPDPPMEPTAVTPADRERFEALGYVGIPGIGAADAVASTPAPDAVPFIEQLRSAVLLAKQDPAAAVDAYRELTNQEPALADVWLHLARTAARLEKHELALEAYGHVRTLTPADAAGHLGASASSLRLRRLDDAEQQAKAGLEVAGADSAQVAEAHELLARVALNRKDVETARVEARAAEEADRDRPVVAFVEGRIALDEGRPADAVTAFQDALASAVRTGRPPLADLRVHAADALLKTERPQDAEQLLTAELAAFPANVRARAALQALQRSAARGRGTASLAQH